MGCIWLLPQPLCWAQGGPASRLAGNFPSSLAKYLKTKATCSLLSAGAAHAECIKPTTSCFSFLLSNHWLWSMGESVAAKSSALSTSAQKVCAVWNFWPLLQDSVLIFLARMGWSLFASLTDRLAGHHLLLMGLCRISLAHMQFFEAKFNAFILATKWFQQLQLREKIRYKLGPHYTYFSSLVKKVKNVWVYFDPWVAFSNVQKTKSLGRDSLLL